MSESSSDSRRREREEGWFSYVEGGGYIIKFKLLGELVTIYGWSCMPRVAIVGCQLLIQGELNKCLKLFHALVKSLYALSTIVRSVKNIPRYGTTPWIHPWWCKPFFPWVTPQHAWHAVPPLVSRSWLILWLSSTAKRSESSWKSWKILSIRSIISTKIMMSIIGLVLA